MSDKSEKIARILEPLQGRALDSHYLGYFECFNRQLFFEAHEVLETLWLPQRGSPKALFYKGLIQLAGAFVHFEKNRIQPAAALLRLARTNLSQYPAPYEGLDTAEVVDMIGNWLGGSGPEGQVKNPLLWENKPKLVLQAGPEQGRAAPEPSKEPGSSSTRLATRASECP